MFCIIKKIIFFIYLVFITFLSLLPSNDLPDIKLFPHADKVIHVGMYAGFTFFLLWAWPQKFIGARQWLPLLEIIILGFILEAIQELGNYGRTFELSDEIANIIGSLPGWLCWKIISKFNL